MVAPAGARFVAFGGQYWLILAITALGCAAALVLGRQLSAPAQRRFRHVSGVAALALCAPFEAVDWVHAAHAWTTSLPLQICDFTWFIAGVALLTGNATWCAVLYYWGLTLTLQAVLTPDLDSVFPHVQFFGYWLRHVIPVWAGIYLVGAQIGPRWRGYRFTLALTAGWAAAVMALNAAVGSNYGFLNAKPSSTSLLSYLGPWPWYLLVEAVLVAGVWALITWPWNRGQRPSRRSPQPR